MTALRKPPLAQDSEPLPSLIESRAPANDQHCPSDTAEAFTVKHNVTILLASLCGLAAVVLVAWWMFRLGLAYSGAVPGAIELIVSAVRAQPLPYFVCVAVLGCLTAVLHAERRHTRRLRDLFAMSEPISASEQVMSLTTAEHLTGRKAPLGHGHQATDPLALARFWADADAAFRFLRADAMLRARTTKPRPA